MHYYLAPMEGITTYIYRNSHARYFGGIDKYFTPFIGDKNMSSREIRDILPENNVGIPLVPQVLTNNADRFLAVADRIAAYGYDTVNLNLGCPSGTVTAKKRGSGFLSVPDELDAFLYTIYEKCPLKISIKTRLGVSDLAEWDELLDIYAKYPIHELIIHTRLQQEFYTGRTHPEAYADAVTRLQMNNADTQAYPQMNDANTIIPPQVNNTDAIRISAQFSSIPLCYNGDIVSSNSLEDTIVSVREHTAAYINMPEPSRQYTDIDRVMIGRGIIRNPALAVQLKSSQYKEKISIENWRAFHDEILNGYLQIMSGDSPALFKMKDLWTYMSRSFTNSDKYLKKIRKTTRISEYVSVVDMLFQESAVQWSP